MSDKEIAINLENVSKCYRIGMKDEMHDSFAGSLLAFLKSPVKNYLKYRSLYHFDDILNGEDAAANVLWALKDVSFEIRRGEAVAIIGRNGAGKSTLLKILSKITDPTSGKGKIQGRVSSLLEVGTGFHPELTGRDNVYLNGTILGMRKKEVDHKFDEIVAFSGVEKFIDTPVKRYSSGMKVRLAFSVAAHLDPDILIVDEVLAVGDADFQKKCLNKMEDVGGEGRTVLFVSHNMPAVTRLCSRAILLDEGRLLQDGASQEVVSNYLTSGSGTMARREWPDPEKAPGGEVARLRSVRVCTEGGALAEAVEMTESFDVEMEYEVLQSGFVLNPHYYFWNQDGICVFGTSDLDPTWRGRARPAGSYVSSVKVPGNFLSEGLMYVNAALMTMGPPVLQFWERAVVAYQVVDNKPDDSARGDFNGTQGGVVRPLLNWTTNYSEKGHGDSGLSC